VKRLKKFVFEIISLSQLGKLGQQINSRFIAGTLMGITNGVATIPGFVSPSVVGALTNGNVSNVVQVSV
jgi:hypothetical protein